MISRTEVVPLLAGACPSFGPVWEKHREDYGDDLLYVALGDFAQHLLVLYQRPETEPLPLVARVIERLHIEGDEYVREAETIGLLEGIQNVWSNNDVDPELFFPFLLPESAHWWRSLNDFWSGESEIVGQGL